MNTFPVNIITKQSGNKPALCEATAITSYVRPTHFESLNTELMDFCNNFEYGLCIIKFHSYTDNYVDFVSTLKTSVAIVIMNATTCLC